MLRLSSQQLYQLLYDNRIRHSLVFLGVAGRSTLAFSSPASSARAPFSSAPAPFSSAPASFSSSPRFLQQQPPPVSRQAAPVPGLSKPRPPSVLRSPCSGLQPLYP